MKKLYFETPESFANFKVDCIINNVKYNIVNSQGKLFVVEIEDSLENDEFLYNNGY